MKLTNSHTTQLDYGQIMTQYHKDNEANKSSPTKNLQVWLLSMAQLMAQLKTEGMIIGNTFFMCKRGSDGDSDKAMFWALNVDTMQNMAENLAEFFTRVISLGVTDFVTIYEPNRTLDRVYKQAFNKIKQPSDTLQFAKVENVTCLHITLLGD